MCRKIGVVCFALVLCALVSVLACSKNTVTQPGPTMYTLWGRVSEGGFGLGGAKVELTAAWGTVSKVTDTSGNYSGLIASGDVTVRAEREGFSAQVKQLTVHENQVVNFELQRIDTPGDPQGVYRLIITASPSCTTLPAEAMQRNYSARIDRTGDDLRVTLHDGNFVGTDSSGWWSGGSEAKFAGTRDGSTIRFTIGEDEVVEMVSSGERLSYVSYEGTATGTIDDRTIAAAFDGTVRVLEANWLKTVLHQCQAKDHRMEFVR